MNITTVGRGNIGGGLGRLWKQAGHNVTTLGRDGGDASGGRRRSSDDLTGGTAAIVDALPRGTRRSLTGEWHGVSHEDLAPVLSEFFWGDGRA